MTRRLRITFERADEFRRELDRNIAKGGAFVPGALDLELREVVDVEVVLRFCDQSLSFEAEVVSALPSGAAVQFLRPAPELREELARLLARAGIAASPARRDEPAAVSEAKTGWDFDEIEEPSASPDPLEQVEDRRRSPRSPARLPARLDGSNARVEGVTRDLSETGALISADASELPPGKAVRLGLRHPETGDRLEVGGRVMRHVETEGTVAAVSVRFEVPSSQQEELAALVRAAKTSHEQRAATGISGRIEELGMPNLIQMLGRSSPCGTLAVRSGEEEGVLAFDAGNLRYARLGAMRGLKALTRLLLWTEGSFEFHAHVDALESEDTPLRLEAALLEATRRIDEAARAPTTRFDGTTRFRVDRAALAAAGALGKTEEAVLDLAAAGFTVRRILDVIPEDDAQVSAALLALIERGVLLARD
jgi:hypothetical protein